MDSHFDGCGIAPLVGVCAVCEGGGKAPGNHARPCGECNGSGRARKGKADCAHYAALRYDADTLRLMGVG